jgi:2-iminobutanoate/2-iminopropanoate deaminase
MSSLPLSFCVRSGHLLFVSGQLAFDDRLKIVPGAVGAQTRRCLENIAAILAREGAGLEDIVKTTVWLTDASHLSEFNPAYAAFFPGRKPARSTVVASLVMPGALVEIEAIAELPAARGGPE